LFVCVACKRWYIWVPISKKFGPTPDGRDIGESPNKCCYHADRENWISFRIIFPLLNATSWDGIVSQLQHKRLGFDAKSTILHEDERHEFEFLAVHSCHSYTFLFSSMPSRHLLLWASILYIVVATYDIYIIKKCVPKVYTTPVRSMCSTRYYVYHM